MKLRSRRRKAEDPIEDFLPTFLEDGHQSAPLSDAAITPETMLARDETRAAVRACIEKLPDSYRLVLLLRDIEELDTEETARMLRVSTNAVKIRLHRARQALLTLLTQSAITPA
jgi:RNA polymerase sigma-70 factor (ECF subfamily)